MDWFWWDTFWSFVVATIWFMTIVSHPDAEIAEAGIEDDPFRL
jgi:hypothetical protein